MLPIVSRFIFLLKYRCLGNINGFLVVEKWNGRIENHKNTYCVGMVPSNMVPYPDPLPPAWDLYLLG